MKVKEKARRKRYLTEFLIRTDNASLIDQLKKVAEKKNISSVNLLIVSELEKLVARSVK